MMTKGSEERPTLRDAELRDVAAIRRIYSPIVSSTAISFEEEPPSEEVIAERIATSHAWLVAESGGEVIGYAYAGRFHERPAYRWSTEVSVYLAPEARGQGLGAMLLTALLDRLRNMGFVNAFAGVALPNPASVHLFEGFGFERIAHWRNVGFKLGKWHDVAWWQLHLRAPSVPPPRLSRE